MTTVGTRSIAWQGGEHDFCLAPLGQVLSLEETCGVGVAAVYKRIVEGTWSVRDVRETIRLALIGGGQTPERALAMVKAHVDANENGMMPSVLLATAILQIYLVGVPGDPVGKKKPRRGPAPRSTTPTDASAAP